MKVYGIYEDKCRVELVPVERTHSTKENKNYGDGVRYINDVVSNVRYVCNKSTGIHINLSSDFDGYFEIVLKRAAGIYSKFSDLIKNDTGAEIKYINDDAVTNAMIVFHYKFYNDGFNLVCECSGYAD